MERFFTMARESFARRCRTAILARSRLLFFGGLLMLVSGLPLYADPEMQFREAFLLIDRGDKAEKRNESIKAVECYRAALKVLRVVRKESPEWYPYVVKYRCNYCEEHIEMNGGTVPPAEDAASESTETKAGPPPAATAASSPGPTAETVEVSPSVDTPAAADKSSKSPASAAKERKKEDVQAEEVAIVAKITQRTESKSKPAETPPVVEAKSEKKEEPAAVETPPSATEAKSEKKDEPAAVESPPPVAEAKNEKKEEPVVAEPPAPAPPSKPEYVGTVVQLHYSKKFVIIKFQEGRIPPLHSKMGVYSGENYAGSVEVVEPVRAPYATADILNGQPQKGGIVR